MSGQPKRVFTGGSVDELSIVDDGANLQTGVAKHVGQQDDFEVVVRKHKDSEQKSAAELEKAKRLTPKREQALRDLQNQVNALVDEMAGAEETDDTPAPEGDAGVTKSEGQEQPAAAPAEVAKSVTADELKVATETVEKAARDHVLEQLAPLRKQIEEMKAAHDAELAKRDEKIAELEKQFNERGVEVAKAKTDDAAIAKATGERLAELEKKIATLMSAAPAPKAANEHTEVRKSGSVFTGMLGGVINQSR